MKKFSKTAYFIKRSLQFRIALVFVLMVLIPVIINGINNENIITEEIESIVTANTTDAIKQQLQLIDDVYNRLIDIANDVMIRPEIKNTLSKYNGIHTDEGISQYNYLREQLNTAFIGRSGIEDVYLISKKYDIYNKDSIDKQLIICTNKFIQPTDLINNSWFNIVRKNPEITQFIVAPKGDSGRDLYNYSNDEKIFLIKGFKDIQTNKYIGEIVVVMSRSNLTEIFSNFGDQLNYSRRITDVNGTVIHEYAFDENITDFFIKNAKDDISANSIVESYSTTIDNKDYLIVRGKSKLSGVNINYAIPKNVMLNKINDIRSVNAISLFICLTLAFSVMVIIFKGVLIPIYDLRNKMYKVEIGDLSAKSNVIKKNEIGELSESFNKMVDSIAEQKKLLLDGEQKKRKLELAALQAQINPHFLYNTLDSIKWMARAQGNDSITKIAQSLIHLLKKTISDTKEFTTIDEEMNNLSYYIEIQRIRYVNSFDYVVEIDKDTQKCSIPKLILQPIVENALFHGIYNCGRRGEIKVTIAKDIHDVLIKIRDNGKGMENVNVEELTQKPRNESFSGIGLDNVKERIKIYYGENYGLNFESIKGEYTLVTIKIPFIIASEENKNV